MDACLKMDNKPDKSMNKVWGQKHKNTNNSTVSEIVNNSDVISMIQIMKLLKISKFN
jgi:hypothetical protein